MANLGQLLFFWIIKNYSAISQITYIEVLSFKFDREDKENCIEELLKSFVILDIDRAISQKAVQNRKVKRIKIPDNILVSTAQVHKLILVTRNINDFKNLEIICLDPLAS
jgi:predicted nucleic acid-binding protein